MNRVNPYLRKEAHELVLLWRNAKNGADRVVESVAQAMESASNIIKVRQPIKQLQGYKTIMEQVYEVAINKLQNERECCGINKLVLASRALALLEGGLGFAAAGLNIAQTKKQEDNPTLIEEWGPFAIMGLTGAVSGIKNYVSGKMLDEAASKKEMQEEIREDGIQYVGGLINALTAMEGIYGQMSEDEIEQYLRKITTLSMPSHTLKEIMQKICTKVSNKHQTSEKAEGKRLIDVAMVVHRRVQERLHTQEPEEVDHTTDRLFEEDVELGCYGHFTVKEEDLREKIIALHNSIENMMSSTEGVEEFSVAIKLLESVQNDAFLYLRFIQRILNIETHSRERSRRRSIVHVGAELVTIVGLGLNAISNQGLQVASTVGAVASAVFGGVNSMLDERVNQEEGQKSDLQAMRRELEGIIEQTHALSAWFVAFNTLQEVKNPSNARQALICAARLPLRFQGAAELKTTTECRNSIFEEGSQLQSAMQKLIANPHESPVAKEFEPVSPEEIYFDPTFELEVEEEAKRTVGQQQLELEDRKEVDGDAQSEIFSSAKSSTSLSSLSNFPSSVPRNSATNSIHGNTSGLRGVSTV